MQTELTSRHHRVLEDLPSRAVVGSRGPSCPLCFGAFPVTGSRSGLSRHL